VAALLDLRVTTAAGSPAVLKVSPDTAFLREQAELPWMFAPSGHVPEVLAASDDAVLLSVVDPGTAVAVLPEPATPAAFDRARAGSAAARRPAHEQRARRRCAASSRSTRSRASASRPSTPSTTSWPAPASPDGITYRLDALSTVIGQDSTRMLRWCRVVAPAVAGPS